MRTRRTRRAWWMAVLLAAAAVPMVAAVPAAADAHVGVSPTTVELELAPGETSDAITKTVQTPTVAPKLDVYLLADTTGSMGGALTDVKAEASTIVSTLEASGSDIAYGAGDYKDFPFDGYAFDNGQPVVDDDGSAALAEVATWFPFGGSDGPEGQFYALDRLANDAGIGWRAGASPVVVWFGDAPAHDPVCSAFTGLGYDITETSVTDDLVAAGVTVIAVGTPTGGYAAALNADPGVGGGDYASTCAEGGTEEQATRIADATGGLDLFAGDPDQVAETILAGLTSLDMTITPVATCDPGLSTGFSPESQTVASGESAEFEETVTVAEDAEPGELTCTVDWQINGSSGAPAFQQTITVTVSEDEECVDLIAGQDLDVGEVCVSGDADEMTVTYSTDDGWVLVETHLHVADEESDVPQTKNGNPIPGQFEHSDPHGSTTEYAYTFDPVDADDWTIAAHAVVEKIDTGVELEAAGRWADTVVDSDQGARKDGSPVLEERGDPTEGLVGDAQTANSFYSLGFGGTITVGFECPIPNLDGDDLSIIEITGGSYPAETALVEAWDPHTGMWVELGTADNSANPTPDRQTASTFDLDGIMYTTMIRITDTTDPALHGATADGFDLDGVESLQACHPILHESAWGEGTEFAFDGRGGAPEGNWGMYFTYPSAE